jgi:hypothetical protein
MEILVINLHMRTDDDKMPDMLKTFTYRYLLKIACLKNVSVCRRENQVHDEKSLTYNNDIPPTDKSNVDWKTHLFCGMSINYNNK